MVLRDAATLEPLLTFPAWAGTLRGATFDCKGRRLAIVATESDVDLWDLAALRESLAALGLDWERPAPARGSATEAEPDRPAVPVIRRPGN